MQPQTHSYQKEIEFSIESEEELVQAFRPRDQKKLILPEGLRYPFRVRSYLTWREPSGIYTYLVFKLPNWDLPRGVAFKKTASGGEVTGGLCSWCHSYGTSEEISFLSVAMSADVSNSYILCNDLSCIEKIEHTAMRAGKDPDKQLAEIFYRMEKLFENISNYRTE